MITLYLTCIVVQVVLLIIQVVVYVADRHERQDAEQLNRVLGARIRMLAQKGSDQW